MSRPRRTIHIDRKIESLWQEDDALCLVGLEECGLLYLLLKPGETVNIKRYQQQLIDLNRSLLKKQLENQKGENTRSFFSMTMLHHIRQNQFGKLYPMRLTHQTCLLPITTCLHRWVTHLLSSALVCTKM